MTPQDTVSHRKLVNKQFRRGEPSEITSKCIAPTFSHFEPFFADFCAKSHFGDIENIKPWFFQLKPMCKGTAKPREFEDGAQWIYLKGPCINFSFFIFRIMTLALST